MKSKKISQVNNKRVLRAKEDYAKKILESVPEKTIRDVSDTIKNSIDPKLMTALLDHCKTSQIQINNLEC